MYQRLLMWWWLLSGCLEAAGGLGVVVDETEKGKKIQDNQHEKNHLPQLATTHFLAHRHWGPYLPHFWQTPWWIFVVGQLMPGAARWGKWDETKQEEILSEYYLWIKQNDGYQLINSYLPHFLAVVTVDGGGSWLMTCWAGRNERKQEEKYQLNMTDER